MSTTTKPEMHLPSDQDSSGRTLGVEEISLLSRAIESGTLTSTKGTFVKQLEHDFAQALGTRHAWACSSGTAALHAAFSAIDPEPGDEIVTTSITDMGALTPILYQGAIPVFADVDPQTYNVTAETIEAALSDRTRAIVVTHLFGNPCNMGPIMELAKARELPVIEDAAQAFGASCHGKKIGTFGSVGCFSLQQGKHITTGEGGVCVTDDEEISRRIFLFINKAWGYGDASPDHYFLALNYRMTELAGAVAVGQLPKLGEVVASRIKMADELTRKIGDLPGIETPQVVPQCVHSYWRYCVNVDPDVIPGGAMAVGQRLKLRGIASAPRYIQKPAFECEIFQKQRTFGNSRFPFTLARAEAVAYRKECFPGTFQALEHVLVLPWNENYTSEHVDFLSDALRHVVSEIRSENH